MNQIIQKKPVLCNLPYTKLKYFHKFSPLSLYGEISYTWENREHNMHRTVFRPNMYFTKNKYA